MLRASSIRLCIHPLLPALAITIAGFGCTGASAAGPAIRAQGVHAGAVVVNRHHGYQGRPAAGSFYGYRRPFAHRDGTYRPTRFSPGEYGFPYASVLPGIDAPLDAAQPLAPRAPGPVSFADLPASTGIRPAPASDPLFMRLDRQQVLADNGERHLWRAGPRIVSLEGAARQPRQAARDDMAPGAPKIIIVRP